MLIGVAVASTQVDRSPEEMQLGRLLGGLPPCIEVIAIVQVPVVRCVTVLVLGLAVLFQESPGLSLVSNRDNSMASGMKLAAVESVDGQFRQLWSELFPDVMPVDRVRDISTEDIHLDIGCD